MRTSRTRRVALAAGACLIALTTAARAASPPPAAPADDFLGALSALCGQAFAGRVVVNEPRAPDDPYEHQRLVMHVRTCEPGRILVPFHVGVDRSRTWVITRTDAGLRLKHDHRHEDGAEDALTMYGGDSTGPGSATRQAFPADAFSRDLFQRQNRAVSITNTWILELVPGRVFAYELTRPGRRFRVEFDLSAPVATPPAPWGSPAQAPAAAQMYGLIGKMTSVDGQRDALIAILLEGIAGMPGCLSYVVAKDDSEPNAIWISEVWASKASHQASLTLASVRAAIAKGRPLIAGFGTSVTTTPVGGHGLIPPVGR